MKLRPYIQIARPDHWFKNVFMVLGIVIVAFYEPDRLVVSAIPNLCIAVLATCLVASSNYVINEILDAKTDLEHPEKRNRPIPAGEVNLAWAWFEWLALALVAFGLAATVNAAFLLSTIGLWVMGLIYNVPPVRAKELPYVDVISESINNPIRLMLGWFALVDNVLPPISLMVSYWGLGAFLMATKRFAELRSLGDPQVAAQYRRSFTYYTQERLLLSMFFYANLCALFGGVFIVRSKLELLFAAPLIAGAMAYYLKLGLAHNSPTQSPERLYKERGFFAHIVVVSALFVCLMLIEVPELYELFEIERGRAMQLWAFRS